MFDILLLLYMSHPNQIRILVDYIFFKNRTTDLLRSIVIELIFILPPT